MNALESRLVRELRCDGLSSDARTEEARMAALGALTRSRRRVRWRHAASVAVSATVVGGAGVFPVIAMPRGSDGPLATPPLGTDHRSAPAERAGRVRSSAVALRIPGGAAATG